MDFVTGLPLSSDWKGNNYNSILVIINRLTKMVYYKPVKITIDAPELAKVTIDVVVQHHGLPDSIISDRGAIFTSKFWSSLCYFLGIKQRLSTAVPLSNQWTDGTTEQHDGSIPLCFCKLGAELLGTALTNGRVHLQQLKKRQHTSHAI